MKKFLLNRHIRDESESHAGRQAEVSSPQREDDVPFLFNHRDESESHAGRQAEVSSPQREDGKINFF
ncbi:hypothetical protein R5R35_001776 [Gryllus longicercus]|uniref:Uncharacterized protein n=1 Tax=Gryllus longicercus TaxID=2509291 RepID=A0AAN9VDL0_9ORTH